MNEKEKILFHGTFGAEREQFRSCPGRSRTGGCLPADAPCILEDPCGIVSPSCRMLCGAYLAGKRDAREEMQRLLCSRQEEESGKEYKKFFAGTCWGMPGGTTGRGGRTLPFLNTADSIADSRSMEIFTEAFGAEQAEKLCGAYMHGREHARTEMQAYLWLSSRGEEPKKECRKLLSHMLSGVPSPAWITELAEEGEDGAEVLTIIEDENLFDE